MSGTVGGAPARLLGPGDPDPVEVVGAAGSSPFVITCEHAGRAVPRALGSLGLAAADLDRHIAWDIGAARVARALGRRLDAPVVLQRYSRLVVDCNRWPAAPDFVADFSEDTPVPGNREVSAADREARRREVFAPYHRAVADILDARRRRAAPAVVVSVHSFTPVFLGERRPWHVGVLYGEDARLARPVMAALARLDGPAVGDNQPYRLTPDKDYAVPVHGAARGLPHVELEIRQDVIGHAAGAAAWAANLERALREARAGL